MASHTRIQCPNCLTSYAAAARFCAVCGRGRDEQGAADPNRSVMLVTQSPRNAPVSVPRRASRTSAATPSPALALTEPTSFSLPTLKPGSVALVAAFFFGLVWIGRWVNAPKKPTHPVIAPISVVKPDIAEMRRVQRRLEAREKRDLHEATWYASGVRAESDADQLRDHLQNSQAPPPSSDPKPFNVIQLPPLSPSAAGQTDSQGQAYPPR